VARDPVPLGELGYHLGISSLKHRYGIAKINAFFVESGGCILICL
jgi:hypothetical protein